MTTYQRRRLSILGDIRELRYIHNSDEKHWAKALLQHQLAKVRSDRA